MPASAVFFTGVFFAAVSVAIFGLALTSGQAEPPVVWGIATLGVVLMAAGGVFRLANPGRRSDGPAAHTVDVDTAMMLRAIFTVAAADGELGEAEIEMIRLVTGQILGRRMSRGAISKAFEDFNALGETSVHNPAFDDAHSVMTPESAYAALKAATLVAFSDGDFLPAEQEKLTALATRLGVPDDRLEACIADARAAYGAVAED